jgi:hypothetical protein
MEITDSDYVAALLCRSTTWDIASGYLFAEAATVSSLFSYILNIVSRFVRRSTSLTRLQGKPD